MKYVSLIRIPSLIGMRKRCNFVLMYVDESLELIHWEGVATIDFGWALPYAPHKFFRPCHKALDGTVRHHHHIHMTSNVVGHIDPITYGIVVRLKQLVLWNARPRHP
ncbi:LOW QUALITY PROTEIN: hypothetical protein PanWU01x14_358730 [Parasponia andersonii]|uniref:Uncharacterized protein n=1 Tax=Parasponia andersonii TaxID=3476 RepID=A0A2P5A870_PARAD|nr:LOW QUALITY PROTEIN: hypothetical protein PanWU01x14_358730 [Parasponia andersonii]